MTRQYRILLLDRTHNVMRQEYIIARDDDAAMEQADRAAGPQEVEVWEGLRQVARLTGRPGKRKADPLSAGPGMFAC
jgi:hypothetical protein